MNGPIRITPLARRPIVVQMLAQNVQPVQLLSGWRGPKGDQGDRGLKGDNGAALDGYDPGDFTLIFDNQLV
jgi:hypothetical protein